jgi:hypothetical protein
MSEHTPERPAESALTRADVRLRTQADLEDLADPENFAGRMLPLNEDLDREEREEATLISLAALSDRVRPGIQEPLRYGDAREAIEVVSGRAD